MIRLVTIFYIFCIFSACSERGVSSKISDNSTQTRNDSLSTILKKTFYETDTVLLIGHTGRLYKPPGQNDTLPPIPLLVINGKLNTQIIKKQKLLAKGEIDTLLAILSKPVSEDEGATNCVFDPHHSIVIIKNGRISYMDMCLSCHQFDVSQNFPSLPYFDFAKWDNLDSFFTKIGVRYYQYKNQ